MNELAQCLDHKYEFALHERPCLALRTVQSRSAQNMEEPMPQSTPIMSMILFLIAAIVGALGQFFYKSGAEQTSRDWFSYLNWRLLVGVLCYMAVMVLFIAAFKRGGSLSVLYPLYASTFIWAALIGLLAYGEPIKPINIAGMVLLIAGMWLMGK